MVKLTALTMAAVAGSAAAFAPTSPQVRQKNLCLVEI